ncbi:cohesin loading factor-domain-containing protein [Xylariaceae sp. FL0804]|nr:cohesin loading factor-domain-containing protein [Xylariaceae sp. FL0804]
MTYRGTLPQGHGPAFNGRQNNAQYPQSSQSGQNGYDSWANPQLPSQYQNPTFAPLAYPPPQPQQQPLPPSHQQTNAHPAYPANHALQPQPPRQHGLPQKGLFRPPSDNSSHGPGPYRHQPSPQNNPMSNMPPPAPQTQPAQQTQAQQMLTSIQPTPTEQHIFQPMDWSQTVPPLIPHASPSYARAQPQALAPSQHPNPLPQAASSPAHVNSPIMTQSPRLAQQQPIANHSQRNSSAAAANATVRAEPANRVSKSPRFTAQAATRSPSVSSTKSPAPTPGLIPHHQDTGSLLVCVAEEFFARARQEIVPVAEELVTKWVYEYQKLIATGLGCLEAALATNKLPRRVEARVRLRYASILCDETNNVMEAETALTKGITLCERNRFVDLKYLMQFLQIKLLWSQGKERAALIAVDGRIRDAEVLKHYHWVYAYRFLKASFYLQFPNPTEAHALENLRVLATIASQRSDAAVSVTASLLEGISHLIVLKDESIPRIQSCLAQASRHQLQEVAQISQLETLALVLDLACSIHQKSPKAIPAKLATLHHRMDTHLKADKGWDKKDTALLLPLRKQRGGPQIISEDTAGILKPGTEDGQYDYLTMSFWSKMEAYAVSYIFSSLALLYEQPRRHTQSYKARMEASSILQTGGRDIRGLPDCLESGMKNADWRRRMKCYIAILQGLNFASTTQWADLKSTMTDLEKMVRPELGRIIVLYTMYLAGVYHQGTGNFTTAIQIYNHPNFALDTPDTQQGHRQPAEWDVIILAKFCLIWVMQEPGQRNDQLTRELLGQLQPLCAEHANAEMQTAWHLVVAAVQTEPPVPMTRVKTHIQAAINSGRELGDAQALAIGLGLMRARLFQNVVGDQAMKSARAAQAQARRSGNLMWISAAEGMLAQTHDVQGQAREAEERWQEAVRHAALAVKSVQRGL